MPLRGASSFCYNPPHEHRRLELGAIESSSVVQRSWDCSRCLHSSLQRLVPRLEAQAHSQRDVHKKDSRDCSNYNQNVARQVCNWSPPERRVLLCPHQSDEYREHKSEEGSS